MKKFRIGLKWKIGILIMLLLFIMMLAVRYIMLDRVKEVLIKEVTERGKTITRNLLKPATDALIGTEEEGVDFLTLGMLASQSTANSGITYAYILDKNNIVRAYSVKNKQAKNIEIRDKLYREPAGLILIEEKDSMIIREDKINGIYDIEIDLKFGDKKVGRAKIGLSQESITNAIKNTLTIAIRVTVVILIVGLIAAFLLAHYIVIPIKLLVSGVEKIGKGNFDQEIKVKARDELGDLTDAFNKMAKGLKEKETIKDAFTRYISKDVMEQVLKEPVKLGGEKKEATVFFSDIRNFTSISEKSAPEVVVEILNEYFTLMTEIVFKYEGTVSKYLGDGLMCVFGVPLTHNDDPFRAVSASLDMLDVVNELDKKWSEEGKPPLSIGIGINTGEVIAGNIGSTKRMEYTIIGDTVNLTQRIETLNKTYSTKLLISSSTYSKVKDHFNVREIGEAHVKGKEESVHLFEVLGRK